MDDNSWIKVEKKQRIKRVKSRLEIIMDRYRSRPDESCYFITKQETELINAHIEYGNEYNLIGCNCCDDTKISLILNRYVKLCRNGCFCCSY